MTRMISAHLFGSPDYKLNPPAQTPDKLLQRHALLENLRHLQAHKKKTILIEARAGSGKSVFAQQYIQESGRPFGWCQLGPEDHDPVALLHVFVVLLQQQLPEFQSRDVAQALDAGSMHHREVLAFARLLVEEINNTQSNGFILVLDDVHLLDGALESISLLTTLIIDSPAWLQWVLVSRHSVKKVLQLEHFHSPLLVIEGDDLDFSMEECTQLFQHIFGVTLSFEQIREICRQTEGWVTGLALCAMKGQVKQKKDGKMDLSFGLHTIQHHLTEYFQQDVLADYSQVQIEELLQLVLLEDFSTPLLKELFGESRGKTIISGMKRSNCFLRCLDEENEIFSFHHLFRESLVSFARQQLSEEVCRAVTFKAAHYHLEKNEPLRALLYAVQSDDIIFAEEILRDFGLVLLHRNQIKTLHTVLETFPEGIRGDLPWVTFYYGACMQDSEPVKALPYLKEARRMFSEKTDEIGLLVTNSQLIEYHAIIDCQFNLMVDYIADQEKLYQQRTEKLPLPLELRILYSLAMGSCFLQMDMGKTKIYDTLVLELSMKNGLDNLTAMAHLIRAYRHSFVGGWSGARLEVEASLPFMKKGSVAALTRIFINLLQVNLLEMTGEFGNYREQKKILEGVVEQDVLVQSIINPLLAILDADMALAHGDVEAAESFILNGMQYDFTAEKPHMRSQFLHYCALIFALQQKKDKALAAIRESLALRKQTGANSFIILNHQIIGAAYAHLGLVVEAEEQFQKVLDASYDFNEEFSRTAVYAHRAWMYLQTRKRKMAFDDIRQCLELMNRNGYRHFFSFLPMEMEPLLKLAIQNNIEPGFATWLLAEQMDKGVTREGDLISMLEIRLLSSGSIVAQDGRFLAFDDFTRNEKRLLCFLLESPNGRMDLYSMAEQLWPDKNESKQRSSLDVLISRLRKKMAAIVYPAKSKEYLSVEQGIIKLQHCHVDVLQFHEYSQRARKHLVAGELWQAGNNFHLAFQFFQGDFALDHLFSEFSVVFQCRIETEIIQASKGWASLLVGQGHKEQACTVLESAFQRMSENFQLARQLFVFYLDTQNSVEAQRTIQRFRKACRDSGYDPEEINTTVAGFWKDL